MARTEPERAVDGQGIARLRRWDHRLRRMALRAAVALGLSCGLVAGLWIVAYPTSNDPKNIRYVFWKWGAYPMDVDTATQTMIGDPGRDRLVVGRTKRDIERRFGALHTPEEATPYLRACYEGSPWHGKRALFIRHGPWMVVFDGEKAVGLVLVKGC